MQDKSPALPPQEIQEALEWKARDHLGPEASRLAVASFIKYMNSIDVLKARAEHAAQSSIFNV